MLVSELTMLEKDILDSLDDLGYNWKNDSHTDDQFSNNLFSDSSSSEFTDLVHWLSIELQKFCKLEESVNKVSSSNDFNSFLMELSSFLREINCPYSSLTDGPISQRMSSKENRLLLLNFLCTELQAARMIFMNNAQTSKTTPAGSNSMQITESETAASLRLMLMSLGFSKPPPNITSQQLFVKVIDKVKEHLNKVPKDHIGHPLFSGVLSESQWETLSKINDSMNQEYKGRNDMLLKRLDVTVQSFTWSERVKKKEDDLHKIYQPLRQSLSNVPKMSFVDLLAARSDLLIVDITSGKQVREKTKSKINKVLMYGKVPDRGGRPSEIEPPPPEMPPWQQRSGGGGGGHGRGGGPQAPRQGGRGGGGGGGRVQSGWSSGGDAQNWGGGYDQHGGGHHQKPGGHHGGHQGGYNQGAYGQQQQGAAYYQDFYNTGGGGYQQQQQTGYQQDSHHHKRGGGGGRGRGGGRGGGHNYR